MSKERVLNALKGLGLTNTDTQVYVFLAKNGPKDLRNIALELGLHQRKAYRSIKDLKEMHVVCASIHHPLEFAAVSFEEVMDLFIKVKKEQAKAIQESRGELLSSWRSFVKGDKKGN